MGTPLQTATAAMWHSVGSLGILFASYFHIFFGSGTGDKCIFCAEGSIDQALRGRSGGGARHGVLYGRPPHCVLSALGPCKWNCVPSVANVCQLCS
jgi:hypothetical protein